MLGHQSLNEKLFSFDTDDKSIKENKIKNYNFHLIQSNFKFFDLHIKERGINKVDGILADLGVSSHQIDNNRVISGSRTFELINFDWDRPYQIIELNRDSGALKIPLNTYHRSVSGEQGSIVINQAQRDDLFETNKEFRPVSVVKNEKLNNILKTIKPIIYKI